MHILDSRKNVADALTKPLPGNIICGMVKPLLYENPWESMWPGDDIDLSDNKGDTKPTEDALTGEDDLSS